MFKGKVWDTPWIGFLEIGSVLCIGYGFSNFLVVFPPADHEEFYEQVAQPKKLSDLGNKLILPMGNSQSLPLFVMFFEHRIMIFPDTAKQGELAPDIINFPKADQPPIFSKSYLLSKQQFDKQQQEKRHFKVKKDQSVKRVSLNKPAE